MALFWICVETYAPSGEDLYRDCEILVLSANTRDLYEYNDNSQYY